jgi:hypothetical protein
MSSSRTPAPSEAFRAECDAKKAAREAEKTARRHRHEEAFYDRRRARQDRADEAYEAALKREEKRNRKAAAQRAAAGAAPKEARAPPSPPGGKRREEEAPPPPPVALPRTDLLATLGLTVIRDTHGVGHEPDTAAIKSAYRRLALRYHPDKNGGDSAACEAFKRIANAYERLTATTP